MTTSFCDPRILDSHVGCQKSTRDKDLNRAYLLFIEILYRILMSYEHIIIIQLLRRILSVI